MLVLGAGSLQETRLTCVAALQLPTWAGRRGADARNRQGRVLRGRVVRRRMALWQAPRDWKCVGCVSHASHRGAALDRCHADRICVQSSSTPMEASTMGSGSAGVAFPHSTQPSNVHLGDAQADLIRILRRCVSTVLWLNDCVHGRGTCLFSSGNRSAPVSQCAD